MKQTVLFAAIVLLAATTLVQAQDELHGFLDLTYQSKYLWRGIDVYGDKSAIQPTVMLDLYGTGLGFSVQGHRANASGYENGERWDYTLFYKNALYMDESYATQYMIGWRYFNFPDMSSQVADLQEIHAVLSWPKVLPVEGLVPTYVLVKLWPSEHGSIVGGKASGFAHIFMLDYGLPIEDLLPNMPEQVLNLHGEIVYNDGVDPRGIGVDHDWTNAVFGVSTDITLEGVENVTITPGVYYQLTMDNSINPDQDETWCTLGVKYSF